MNLLVVGQVDSIFFRNYCTALKDLDSSIKINAFSISQLSAEFNEDIYERVEFCEFRTSFWAKLFLIRTIIQPLYEWYHLYMFLKTANIKYDIIHYKWLRPGIIILPRFIKKYTKRIIATPWGGEFEHQTLFFSKRLYTQALKKFLNAIDITTYTTDESLKQISSLNIKHSKVRFLTYGSSITSELIKLKTEEGKSESKLKLGLQTDEIVIAIGYSGKDLHQHIRVIKELGKSKEIESWKDRLLLLLPMTYGRIESYVAEVEKVLIDYNFKYKILTSNLSDKEVARLRNACDIMIQASSFDGLSSSIRETIIAGGILIVGDWLPYNIFNERSLYFHQISKIEECLSNVLLDVLDNLQLESENSGNNIKRWGIDETWEVVIKKWFEAYNELLSC